MPRSKKIYVVMSHDSTELLGAFTVQHEMLTCAAQCDWGPSTKVYELKDGPEKYKRNDPQWAPYRLEQYRNGHKRSAT